jgi:hypothetical protein
MNRSHLVAAVAIGVALGACAREVIREVSPRAAHAQGPRQYMVRGASGTIGGYERDLNDLSAEGWRYVGPLPLGNTNPALVFER